MGNDPDDASPLIYQWVVKGSGLVGGASEIIMFTLHLNDNEYKTFNWKPADYVLPKCGGRSVQLELRVTDPENKTGTETIPVTIAWPPC